MSAPPRPGLLQREPRLGWKLFAVLVAGLMGGFLGEAYSDIFYAEAELASQGRDYLIGFRNGFMIAAVATAIEAFYMRGYRVNWIKRLPFLPAILIRVAVITIIIRVILVGNAAATEWLTDVPILSNTNAREQARDTLFSLGGVVLFVAISQIGAMIGGARAASLLLGRYFRPVEEDRVFLFVDFIGSSQLARTLGDVQFHEVLSEFFWQIDRAIVRHGGEIVSYVGDAVIVTWRLTDDRRRNARCLRAVADMVREMDRRADWFEATFGHRPQFRAALHGGRVVVGECGDSRRQITFLGDTVNVAARMETHARDSGERILISEALLRRLELPEGLIVEQADRPVLRGQAEPIGLHRLRVA